MFGLDLELRLFLGIFKIKIRVLLLEIWRVLVLQLGFRLGLGLGFPLGLGSC